MGFPDGSGGKECNAGATGDTVSRFPGEGNGNTLQYSCLENSMDRANWQAIVCEVVKSWTQLSN